MDFFKIKISNVVFDKFVMTFFVIKKIYGKYGEKKV